MNSKEHLRRVRYSLMTRAELEAKGSAAYLNRISDIEQRDGFFHGWATDSDIVNSAQGHLTVHRTSALVEDKARKKIVKVRYDLIEFID